MGKSANSRCKPTHESLLKVDSSLYEFLKSETRESHLLVQKEVLCYLIFYELISISHVAHI